MADDSLERQIFEAASRAEEVNDQDIDASVSEAIRAVTPHNGSQPQQQPAERRPPSPQGRDPLEGVDDRSNSGLLRALLDERDRRQELHNQLQRYQTREREQARQTERPPINERLFIDPEGTLNELRQEWTRPLEQQLVQVQINQDFAMAQGRHGLETFQQAWEHWYETVRDGKDAQTYFGVMNSPSPGEAMVSWFKRQKRDSEVGDDLDAYNQRIIDNYLASQGMGSSPARAPDGKFTARPQAPRLPTSISRISAPSNHSAGDEDANDGSEDAIFAAARPPPRRR